MPGPGLFWLITGLLLLITGLADFDYRRELRSTSAAEAPGPWSSPHAPGAVSKGTCTHCRRLLLLRVCKVIVRFFFVEAIFALLVLMVLALPLLFNAIREFVHAFGGM